MFRELFIVDVIDVKKQSHTAILQQFNAINRMKYYCLLHRCVVSLQGIMQKFCS